MQFSTMTGRYTKTMKRSIMSARKVIGEVQLEPVGKMVGQVIQNVQVRK